ncbi:LysR family transcriptional regulator [Bosea sp. 47.2.35]|jgi:DNA-binding transcriptional LysR family regulator|uniref:LysR family transcriptional regulator n=1 Tax=Bosea sp. 47.2.35 TaxID=2969304 RepID=UPI0021505058|nr:LysR family transcriptional regulator [Bosea sp. 47.2.35]MCR4524208.1 LysR family transcriptional regulator [Bosea sp. 47.2.35]
MLRENIDDLLAFVAVAREGSFTRAAAQIGVSQSALSHAIKGLEERIGVRLLTRTTRKVVPTAVGERIMKRMAPHFVELEDELASVIESRDSPAGLFRITATDYAADTILWPKLKPLLKKYPDISVEIVTDYALTDIIGEKIDAGVRLGESVSDGMIAVRVGPDFRMVAIGAPSYFKKHGVPETPQELTRHRCVNLRLPTHGGLYAWEFEQRGREIRVRVEGQLIFNTINPCVQAAVDGFGIAYVPQSLTESHVKSGRLQIVLDEWSPPFPGYFLYYPHRRQSSPAFSLIVDALRHREP